MYTAYNIILYAHVIMIILHVVHVYYYIIVLVAYRYHRLEPRLYKYNINNYIHAIAICTYIIYTTTTCRSPGMYI